MTHIRICVDLQQSYAVTVFGHSFYIVLDAFVDRHAIFANSCKHGLASIQIRIELHAKDLMIVVLADVIAGKNLSEHLKGFISCSFCIAHLYLYRGCTILGALIRRHSLFSFRVFGDLLLLRVVVVVVLKTLAESTESVSSISTPVPASETVLAICGVASSVKASPFSDCSSLLSLELFSIIARLLSCLLFSVLWQSCHLVTKIPDSRI